MDEKIKYIGNDFFVDDFMDSRLGEITSIEWSVAPYAMAVFFDYSNEWESGPERSIPIYRGGVFFESPLSAVVPKIEPSNASIVVGLPFMTMWSEPYQYNNEDYTSYNFECDHNDGKFETLQIVSCKAFCFTSRVPFYSKRDSTYVDDLTERMNFVHNNASNLDFFNAYMSISDLW